MRQDESNDDEFFCTEAIEVIVQQQIKQNETSHLRCSGIDVYDLTGLFRV